MPKLALGLGGGDMPGFRKSSQSCGGLEKPLGLRSSVVRFGLGPFRAPSAEPAPDFFCYPDGPNEEINWPLQERGLIALDAVAEEQHHPAPNEENKSPAPGKE